jgi:hypothetical protein
LAVLLTIIVLTFFRGEGIVHFSDIGGFCDYQKESLNSDGQHYYQYQQNKQSPLT